MPETITPSEQSADQSHLLSSNKGIEQIKELLSNGSSFAREILTELIEGKVTSLARLYPPAASSCGLRYALDYTDQVIGFIRTKKHYVVIKEILQDPVLSSKLVEFGLVEKLLHTVTCKLEKAIQIEDTALCEKWCEVYNSLSQITEQLASAKTHVFDVATTKLLDIINRIKISKEIDLKENIESIKKLLGLYYLLRDFLPSNEVNRIKQEIKPILGKIIFCTRHGGNKLTCEDRKKIGELVSSYLPMETVSSKQDLAEDPSHEESSPPKQRTKTKRHWFFRLYRKIKKFFSFHNKRKTQPQRTSELPQQSTPENNTTPLALQSDSQNQGPSDDGTRSPKPSSALPQLGTDGTPAAKLPEESSTAGENESSLTVETYLKTVGSTKKQEQPTSTGSLTVTKNRHTTRGKPQISVRQQPEVQQTTLPHLPIDPNFFKHYLEERARRAQQFPSKNPGESLSTTNPSPSPSLTP